MRRLARSIVAVLVLLAAAGPQAGLAQAVTTDPLAPLSVPRPQGRQMIVPDARWDHRSAGAQWTLAGLRAMAAHGQAITDVVPRDIAAWCPGYAASDAAGRRAFWVGFLSALAYHESTWNPRAVGGGGQWFGLLQIYPPTARHFGCRARSGAALQDGAANVACAVRILATTIPRDRAIALRDSRWRGVAADWGPMRDAGKVAQMQAWTRVQPYCRVQAAPRVALRPRARPLVEPPPVVTPARDGAGVAGHPPATVPVPPVSAGLTEAAGLPSTD